MEKQKSADKPQKKSWFQGLQSEFEKIVWTDRPTLAKQTVVVVSITIILAAVISVMDPGGTCSAAGCSGDEERNLKTGSEKDVSRLCASQYGDE